MVCLWKVTVKRPHPENSLSYYDKWEQQLALNAKRLCYFAIIIIIADFPFGKTHDLISLRRQANDRISHTFIQ